jgi:outer membrane protein W
MGKPTGSGWLAALLGLALCGASHGVAAEGTGNEPAEDTQSAGVARLQEFLKHQFSAIRRRRPDWIVEQSHGEIDPQARPGDDAAQLVLQQDRRDGADLLTLRYPLAERGALRAYAGAGLNQAVYFEDGGEPAIMSRRNRDRSLGAAAELGAELRLSERLLLQADLRWAELDEQAALLRSEDGLVGADALSLGVSIGWHFR